MDEGSRKAIEEKIERVNSKKSDRVKQWEALEAVASAFQQGEQDEESYREAPYDIVRDKLVEFLGARAKYCADTMRDMGDLLDCLEMLLKEKLAPEERVKFELLEGLTIGWRETEEDHLLDNMLNHFLVGFVLVLLDESRQLEPIRKGVGVLVPAMQQFRERLKEARQQEERTKKTKEEWMRRHSSPKERVFT